MGLLKRFAGFLGLLPRDENHETSEDDDDRAGQQETRPRGPTNGFSVQLPVPVAVDRPHPGPVLVPCNTAQGGVQGLKWYAERLRMDEDGDFADEFLCEVFPESSGPDDCRPVPKFEVKYSARRVIVRDQRISAGNILQGVEYKGRLQWV